MKLKNYSRKTIYLLGLGVVILLAAVLLSVNLDKGAKKIPANPKAPAISQPSNVLASYSSPFPNGLITNEYAFYNSSDPSSHNSNDWQMTSGSLFAKDGYFWTGKPDSCDSPNANSSNCTDSDVFRLNTAKQFDGNIMLSFSLKQNAEIHNSNCNSDDTCWHGTHAWLRYLTQYNLYYVSVNRADGQVVIKRKVPCGSDNSGTYFVLGDYIPHNFKTGQWNSYSTSIQTNSDGSVTIKVYDDSVSKTQPIDTGTDRGGTNPNWSASCSTQGKYSSSHYPPITQPGSVGIRGDYANFEFTNFVVSRLN